MSRHKFDPNCPGCQPAILDMENKTPLPPDHPMMLAMKTVWDATSDRDKASYHNVMCNNSRLPSDLRIVQRISQRLQRICERMPAGSDARN